MTSRVRSPGHRPSSTSPCFTLWAPRGGAAQTLPSLALAALSLLGAAAGSGCEDRRAKGVLTVSAAMSLKDAFTELGQRFERRHPGRRVRFNFAGSGVLATQILGGAPVDVFASASPHHLDRVARGGLLVPDARADIAGNRLVVVQPRRAAVALREPGGLRGLGRVALGNPESVPAGRYARAWLEHHGLYASLRPRLVFGEHVRQVLDYVARREVDAGLVYATDYRKRASDLRLALEAKPGTHPPITYPMAVLKRCRSPELGRAFLAFVRSAEGQAVLARHGFLPPGAPR